ncbi:unnamed protein product [Phaedon cochleariae]|uniref:CHK kinase-like domain-containing protein n=1 Tax=Phaedon cochleariae TaxID=80249 RepID=A0A9P0DS71_PHACE|nr:unnamed protein product [Phaedon cochleariae]
MTTNIPVDIRAFLETSVGDDLTNYQIEVHEGNKKGEGYLGDLLFVSLTNRKTNEELHLVIKQALASGTETSSNFVSSIFQNESSFYENLWPSLKKFQGNFPNAKQFLKVPKHYAIDTKKGAEKILLENLRYKGFRNHVKTDFFKKEQLEYVLKCYGQFHAISMALRQINPEHFQEIADRLVECSGVFSEMPFFQQAICLCCQDVISSFNETEEKIVEKFKVYAKKGPEIFNKIRKYNGINRVIIHGDCWSNNIMFKYNDNDDIEDIRFIDFQLTRVGTVVYDLSYCIYASCSGETIDNLDYYLKIYHQSLSESLKGYDLDPELIYSYENFKDEWKQYSKFGLIMGLLANSGKHRDLDSVPELTELIDNQVNGRNDGINPKINRHISEKFLDIGRSLVLHACKNGYV